MKDNRYRLKPEKVTIRLIFGIIVLLSIFSYILAQQIDNPIVDHISITFSVLVIVVLIFEVILRNDTLEMIENIFNKVTDEAQIKSNIILRAVKEAKIKAIYSDRKEASNEISTYFNFNNLVKSPCEDKIKIDLLGICLRDFFKDGGPLKTAVTNFFNSKDVKNSNIIIRIMILYPYSNDAVIRMIKEKQRCHGSKDRITDIIKKISAQRLMDDSRSSMEGIWEMYTNFASKDKFEVRICTISPTHFLLRFNDIMFVESYHLGCDKKTREITSGKIFMTCFSATKTDTERKSTFNYLKDYFDALWDDETTVDMEKIVDTKGGVTFLKPEELIDEIKEKIQQNITTLLYYK